MLNEYISQAEEQGHIISKKYYDELIKNEKANISELKKEQAALIAERDNAVDSGKIAKYSEEWYSMCQEIDSVTQAIEQGTTALIEYDNAMRDIDWSVFDLIQERMSDITAESDFLIELMSNKKLFEDDGKLTSEGLATVGLHSQNYNTYMYQSDELGKEIAELDKQLAKGYDKALEERRRELIQSRYDAILAAEQEKEAIRDLVEESIDLELSALDDLITKYQGALDSQKDLFDYQRKIESHTKNIGSLEKQIASYEGDTSEESKVTVQRLKLELEEANKDLESDQFDRYITQQEQLLDSLYTEYELKLGERLDNTDDLIRQVIDSVNIAANALGSEGSIAAALSAEGALAFAVSDNATSIGQTLKTETDKVGMTLSSAMNNIWNGSDGSAKSVLTMYGDGFQNKQTTTNTELSNIKLGVDKLVAASNKEAEKKVNANKTSTSAKKDPTKDDKPKTTTTNNKPATTSNSSKGDGKPKVGDKVKFVSGQYYYDSQGKKPLGYHNRGKEVYITSINNAGWATHKYHISTGNKLGKGDLGWLKLNQLSGYAFGKYNFQNDEVAWTQEGRKQEFIVRPSDGAILTPVAKGDSVLTSAASKNIWNMANNPAEFIKDNLNIGNTNVPNNSNIQSTYNQTIENVTFRMDNVKNYDEILTSLSRDKNFDRLIESMTLGKLAGKSSLAKGKAIR